MKDYKNIADNGSKLKGKIKKVATEESKQDKNSKELL
jgi:hypothetical protein